MTLPNAILFPQALLPLYIFEPRYRRMLKKSLEDQRMFAIALTDESPQPQRIGGVGLIRACVDNPDGSSNLILQGVSRVRFTGFVQKSPYWVGRIEILRTENADALEVDALAAKGLELIRQMSENGEGIPEGMIGFLKDLKDYDAFADIVTYSFLEDVRTKQEILETLDLRKRLHKVVVALQKQISGPDISVL